MANGAISCACMPKCIPEAPLLAFLVPLLRLPLGEEVGAPRTEAFEGGATPPAPPAPGATGAAVLGAGSTPPDGS